MTKPGGGAIATKKAIKARLTAVYFDTRANCWMAVFDQGCFVRHEKLRAERSEVEANKSARRMLTAFNKPGARPIVTP